jgi:polysaccharide export outer membrane protein
MVRSRVVLLVLATTICWTVVAASAQQPATGSEPNAGVPQVPAAEPVPQPGIPAATKTDNAAKPLDDKDTSDQSALIKLGPGDLIEVNVYNVPELTTKARVSLSGDVYLPLIDYVHLEGLTQEEAQSMIEKRLADGGFVRNPHVTIFVDEAASQGITIIGEVAKPGIYADTIDRKLYSIISQAGGFTVSASRNIAIIHRNQMQAVHVSLPRNLGDDLSGDVEILPGDTITVPRAPIIYVVGDVGRPAGFLVDNGTLTVLQALALAGGTNHTAKLGGARIIRKSPTGLTVTTVKLKQMLEAKSPDVTLQADDILFVPVSGARVAVGKTVDVAVAMATAVGIYSIHP